jgi:CHASE2 domain-containing sensor protein
MLKSIHDFMNEHLILAALLVSAAWLVAGYQDHVRRKGPSVFLWWTVVAVLVLFAFCINAILTGAWLSLAIAVAAILAEIWLIRRWYRQAGFDA